jgi:hypothetical protein
MNKKERIVVLPCDIGDIFYSPFVIPFRPEHSEVRENRVSGLQKKADGTWKIRLTVKSSVYDITPNEIGKTVFYTKEEAEKKLKELLIEIKKGNK